ncbi:MAG: hypothetical protein IT379_27350 [Deltaproteobacteria bacterium]|nr:hypothetical protein [Deltaproteobacteria bacterium]
MPDGRVDVPVTPLPPCPFEGEPEPTTVAAGGEHTCAVESGRLYCWGSNDDGKLGLGRIGGTEPAPQEVMPGHAWVSVAGGWDHTCAIDVDGALWCWGRNADGQLGVGDTDTRDVPTRVGMGASPWVQVAGGAQHTCAIRRGGFLHCWGRNNLGQLGAGAVNEVLAAPTRVEDAEMRWSTVAAGSGHTCAVTTAGDLFCFGDPTAGETGQPVRMDLYLLPLPVAGSACWRSAAGTIHSSCGVQGDGRIACWGQNQMGQLGRGFLGAPGPGVDGCECIVEPQAIESEATFRSVDGGRFHACAIALDGGLWCWGRAQEAQVGFDAAGEFQPTPVAVPVAGRWIEVSAGGFHTCSRRDDGSLWCVGQNLRGQVGLGGASMRVGELTRVVFR